MPMPLRNSLSDYRYAYQGQEKDPETGKEAFQLRLWDARIGRWLTTDPYGEFASPYLGMGNNPISLIDPDGGSGENVYKKTYNTETKEYDTTLESTIGGDEIDIVKYSGGALDGKIDLLAVQHSFSLQQVGSFDPIGTFSVRNPGELITQTNYPMASGRMKQIMLSSI